MQSSVSQTKVGLEVSPRLQGILSVLIFLMIPVLLVLGSIRLLLTESYLHIAYDRPGFPADPYGFSPEERLRYAPDAVHYLLNGENIGYLERLTLPDGTPLYTARELKHMEDVKTVVQYALMVQVGLILVFMVCALYLARSPDGRAALRRGLFGGGLLMLGSLGVLLLYLVLDWNRFFNAFHDLFFARGTWQFMTTDTLIRLFPIRFWQDAAITIGAMCAGGAVAVMGLSWQWGRQARRINAMHKAV